MIKNAFRLLGALCGGLGLSTLFLLGAPGAALADGPNIVLSQGQVPATTTQTSNGLVDEYQVYVGNGYSGTINSMIIAIGGEGCSGTGCALTNFGGAFTGYIRQASTSPAYGYDTECDFEPNQLADYDSTTGFLTMPATSPCTLQPGSYTSVGIDVYRSHSVKSVWATFSYGSLTNNRGWNWAHTGFNGVDCANYWNGVAWTDICYSEGFGGTGFYPYFSVLGGSWSLVPTTTSSGIFFSGASEFCNNAFASSTGIGATIGNGVCLAAGFLFIPTSDSVAAFQSIPTQIAQSFPFSWITQMRSILSAATASSSENFIDLNIDFGTTTAVLGFENLDVISTTTISRYMSDSTRNLVKGLLAAVFYLAAAAFIYRELQKIWETS